MKIKDVYEMADAGTTSVGSGAIAQVERKVSPIKKRDYINIFLTKRKKLRAATNSNDWFKL